jgi:hypothetical protein
VFTTLSDFENSEHSEGQPVKTAFSVPGFPPFCRAIHLRSQVVEFTRSAECSSGQSTCHLPSRDHQQHFSKDFPFPTLPAILVETIVRLIVHHQDNHPVRQWTGREAEPVKW